jgi:hypothetical protein
MSQGPRTDVRLLNLCKRLKTLAELEKSYSLKAVADEIEVCVRDLLHGKG